MGINAMKEKDILFVCGCPRSGTTSLWSVLIDHSEVMLGVERYGHRIAPDSFSLTRDLFSEARFFDVQPNDTFYGDLEKFNPYYGAARSKYPTFRYLGDKIPLLFNAYTQLFTAIPGVKVIFIFRNLFDVANSYNHRARNPEDATWSEDLDYKGAVNDWNASLHKTLAAKSQGLSILCVEYERLWNRVSGCEELERITRFLSLPISKEYAQHFSNWMVRNDILESERRNKKYLDPDEKVYLLSHADVDAYRRIRALAAEQLIGVGGE